MELLGDHRGLEHGAVDGGHHRERGGASRKGIGLARGDRRIEDGLQSIGRAAVEVRHQIPQRAISGRAQLCPDLEQGEADLGPVVDAGEDRAHQVLDALANISLAALERLDALIHERADDQLGGADQELFLAVEVVVDAALAHAGALGDRLHGGAVVAALGEHGEGGLGELLLALCSVDESGHWQHIRPLVGRHAGGPGR